MSLANIKKNASPESKALATKLETSLLGCLDSNVVQDLFSATIPEAMIKLNRYHMSNSVLDEALDILQDLQDKANPDALPLAREVTNLVIGCDSHAFSRGDDGLLSDVNEALLFTRISDKFGLQYLSVAEIGDEFFPVDEERHGIVYGEHSRPMIALPCQHGDKPLRWVFFIVDTGAPTTEISPRAMDLLCNADSLPSCVNLKVAGIKIEVMLCDQGPKANHKDVPVLGKNFYNAIGARLLVDYAELMCSLVRRK